MKYQRNARELKERSAPPPAVIGITGGIASGKTVATDALKSAGYTVVDADEISRALTAPGTKLERRMAAAFPDCTKAGSVERRALRKKIGRDQAARRKLEELTHPAILEAVRREISAKAKPVILSAPLLFESGLSSLCDCVICIHCPKSIRVERITLRDGITREHAAAMIAAQLDETVRATISDYIVPSDRPIAEFAEEVIELVDHLCGRTQK